MKLLNSNVKLFLIVVFLSQYVVFFNLYSMDKFIDKPSASFFKALQSKVKKEIERRNSFRNLFFRVSQENVKESSDLLFSLSFDKQDVNSNETYCLNVYAGSLYAGKLSIEGSKDIYCFIYKKNKFVRSKIILSFELINGIVKLRRKRNQPELEKYPGLHYAAQVMQAFVNKNRSLFDFEKNKKRRKKLSDVVVTCDK